MKKNFITVIIILASLAFVCNLTEADIFLNKARKGYKLSGLEDRIADKKSGPSITIDSPDDKSTVSGRILVKGKAKDNYRVSRIELSINNKDWFEPDYSGSEYKDKENKKEQTCYWQYLLDTGSLPAGQIRIRACAYDREDNRTETEIQLNSHVEDIIPPVIFITDPINNQSINTFSYNVKGTASDNAGLDRVEVRLNNGTWKPASGTGSWSSIVLGFVLGTNRIQARVYDTAGNCATNSVKITNNGSLYVYVSTNGDDSNPGTITLPFRTIQTGIREAKNNLKPVVLISEGLYQEHLTLSNGISLLGGFSEDFTSRDITLINYRTKIDGTASGRCIYGVNISSPVIIEGLVITNGSSGQGAGFYLTGCNTNLQIRYNEIINNTANGGSDYSGGGAFYLNSSCSPKIYNNNINNNSANAGSGYSGGGAFYLYNSCSPEIYNNNINNNSANAGSGYSGGGAFYLNDSCSPAIYNNNINSNSGSGENAGSGGGAFYLNVSCSPVIYNNNINSNSGSGDFAAGGGAFYLHFQCSPAIYNNIINNNSGSGNLESGGGAFYLCINCSPTIINNTFVSNNSQVFFLYQDITGRLINNIISGANAGMGIYERVTSCAFTVFSNNCFNGIQNKNFYYDADTGTYMTNASMLNSMSDISCGHNIAADPRLKPDKIHLLNGSPCINNGINPAGYISALTNDIDGEARPKGTKYDIGADEY